MDMNVDDICNVKRKPGGKNDNGMSDRGQQDSVMAQENVKLTFFPFHHRWRCTFDWEIMGVQEDIVHLLEGQKSLKDEYKDLAVLPEVNKANMARTLEAIKAFLRSCHGVV